MRTSKKEYRAILCLAVKDEPEETPQLRGEINNLTKTGYLVVSLQNTWLLVSFNVLQATSNT